MSKEYNTDNTYWVHDNMSPFIIYLHKIQYFLYITCICWIGLCMYPETKNLIYPHHVFSYVTIIIGWFLLLPLIYSIFKWEFWKRLAFWLYFAGFFVCAMHLLYLYDGTSIKESANTTILFIMFCLMYMKHPVATRKKRKNDK